MTTDPLQRIREAAAADLPRQREEMLQERRARRRLARLDKSRDRRKRWRKRWRAWRAWWKRRVDDLKIAGMVAVAVAGVAKGITSVADTAPVQWVGHTAKRMWTFYMDRDVGPPAQPPPTGAPSTALDFQVTRARPPDGGQR